MTTIPFISNGMFSVGVEIEFQLLDPQTYDLTPKGPELLSQVSTKLQKNLTYLPVKDLVRIF